MVDQCSTTRLIRAGIVEESLMIDTINETYRIIKENYVKYLNVSLEYIEIPKKDVNEEIIFNKDELPMDVDFLFVPFDYTFLACIKNLNITRLSNIFLPSWTFLLSPAPDPQIKATLSFIYVQPKVLRLLVLFLIVVSAIMSLAITRRSQLKPKTSRNGFGLRFENFPQKFMTHLWQNANLQFCEGYPRIPRSLPWRIAFMSWLLGVTLITFEASCYLKSNFSVIKYVKVNTFDDLLEQAGKIKIGIMEGSVEDMFVTQRALTETKFEKLNKILNGAKEKGEKVDVSDLFFGNVFEQVAEKKLIFISSMFVVLATMTHYFSSKENIFDLKEIYYISAPIEESYCVGVFSSTFVGTPLAKGTNKLMTRSLECGLAEPFLRRMGRVTDILQWSEQARVEDAQLTMKGVQSVMLLYLLGNAIAIALFILNIFAITFIKLLKL